MTIMVNNCESSSSSIDILFGYRFQPTDEELICHYLARKVRGLLLRSNFVIEMDAYDREPWLLHNHNIGINDCERYYFVKRTKKSPSGNGKTPNRDSGEGWWKASSGDISILNEKCRVVGYKKTLKFLKYKNSKHDRKEYIKTDWIMHEYRLPHETFQEWVICRIRNLKRKKDDMVLNKEQSESTVRMNFFCKSERDIGVRFKPTNEELVCDYLGRKIQGLPVPPETVIEMDVYVREPWLLHNYNTGSNGCEGYYFVKRTKKFALGNGKTPRRGIDEGWWKATAGDVSVLNEKGHVVGYKKALKFLKYRNNKHNRKECIKTDWIMHEYRLPSESFQEWVICQIRNLKGKKDNMELQEGDVFEEDVFEGDGQNQVPLTLQDGVSESLNLSSDPTLCSNQQELQCPYNLQQDIAPMSMEKESQGLLRDLNQVNDSCSELQGSIEQQDAEQEEIGPENLSFLNSCLELYTVEELQAVAGNDDLWPF